MHISKINSNRKNSTNEECEVTIINNTGSVNINTYLR